MFHPTTPYTLSRASWLAFSLLLGLMMMLAACSPTEDVTFQPISTPTVPPVPSPTLVPIAVVHQPLAPLPKSHTQRKATAVLLLGVDRRALDQGASNTDTLMLVHLDPQGRRVVILSIPRDLYVEIPGHEQGRVNTAYALGEQDGTGGLALASQTVSNTLGIPIQHAALLDFYAFVALIDAIGGVEVDVPHPISDPTYPDGGIGYEPFYLPAGQQHLEGATALKYVRTRATVGGDFDRTARQRQVVLAVRDRVLQLDLLADLIKQSPQLWSALQTAIETDLTLGEIIDLAVTASRVPSDQIISAGIDAACTQPWTTPGGAEVLIPDRAALETLLDGLLAPPSAPVANQ